MPQVFQKVCSLSESVDACACIVMLFLCQQTLNENVEIVQAQQEEGGS